MTVLDTPDWFGGASSKVGFDQTALIANGNVPAGGSILAEVPIGGAPIHALALAAPQATLTADAFLTVTGVTSGIQLYAGYLRAELYRTGRPVIVPCETLFDTQFEIAVINGAVSGLYVWGYSQAVPPMAAYRSAPTYNVNVVVPAGTTPYQLLAAPPSNASYAIWGVNVSRGGAATAIVDIETTLGQQIASMVMPAPSSAFTPLYGIVLGQNVGLQAAASDTSVAYTVNVAYQLAFTPDGSDL